MLFRSELFSGDLLYFDLDVVLAKNLDWIHDAGTDLFWTIRDFRYLQRRDIVSMNSSMMWFNTKQFGWIWDQFNSLNFLATIKQYPGDQDYLNSALHPNQRRFFDDKYFESFRWQCLDGGYDFFKRRHHAPNTGVRIQPDTAVVVFHGRPKPAEVQDPVIQSLWR